MDLKSSPIYKVLLQYNISQDEVVRISELPSGINRVYLIEVGRKKLVLKNYIKHKSPKLDVIHSIVVNLMRNGLGIPEILQNKEGKYLTKIENENYDLSLYTEHVDFSDQIHISKKHLELAANEFAKIHRLTNRENIIQQLEKVDFEDKALKTIYNIKEFMFKFNLIFKAADEKSKQKLLLLKELVELTEIYRKEGVKEFIRFLDQPFVPTHGDYSMPNVLVTLDNKVLIIDWDNLGLRPLIWDLQATLSLFSSKYRGNAYIVEPDMKKLSIFLSAYIKENPITQRELLLLPEVVKYNFAIYWLSYTIPAMLEHDFRLLYLIPSDIEKALYWTKYFDSYFDFIKKFSFG